MNSITLSFFASLAHTLSLSRSLSLSVPLYGCVYVLLYTNPPRKAIKAKEHRVKGEGERDKKKANKIKRKINKRRKFNVREPQQFKQCPMQSKWFFTRHSLLATWWEEGDRGPGMGDVVLVHTKRNDLTLRANP